MITTRSHYIYNGHDTLDNTPQYTHTYSASHFANAVLNITKIWSVVTYKG